RRVVAVDPNAISGKTGDQLRFASVVQVRRNHRPDIERVQKRPCRAAMLVRSSSSAPAVTGIDTAASVATIEVTSRTSSTLKPLERTENRQRGMTVREAWRPACCQDGRRPLLLIRRPL